MITIIALSALFVTSGLVVATFPLPTIPEKGLAFLNYGLAQIILLSVCLSESFGISTKTFLFGQIILTGVAIVVWHWQGRRQILSISSLAQKFKGSDRKSVWIAAGLVAAAGLLLAVNIEFYRSLPSMNKDALSYHLPRAYYWLQQGSLHYLPIDDFRWTEFPPNSSVVLMWMMAVGVGYEWMHLPQVVGAIMIALGVYRLTILCGGNRLAAASAVVICLGFPAVIYQMGTSGNDLLVSGLAVSCVAFLAGALRPGEGRSSVNRSSALTGISLGLGLGTKITLLLFLPALAIFGLGSLIVLGWRDLWSRSWRLLLALAMGFIALGSYSYIQNYRDHGSPMLSDASNIKLSQLPAELYSPVRNIVLSFYQALSWHGLQSLPTQFWPSLQRGTIWSLDRTVGLGLEKLPGFSNDNNLTEIFTDENRAGFGLLGFLILSVSPFVGLVQIGRFGCSKDYKTLLGGSLIIIGLSSLILFCSFAPWGATHVRYCVQFIPLLVPPVLGFLWGPRWLRNICHACAAFFALWVMFFCITLEPTRKLLFSRAKKGDGPLQTFFDGRWLPQRDVIRAFVPEGKNIGYSGRIDSWAFVLSRELPAYQYVLLRPDEIKPALQSGRVKAVITELSDTDATESLPLPGTFMPPKQSLYTRKPEAVLLKSLAAFGLTLKSDRRALTLNPQAIETFSSIHQLWPEELPYLKILLPISPLQSGDSDLRVEIPLTASFPGEVISNVTCNSHEVPFSVDGGLLVFVLAGEMIRQGAAVQECVVTFKSKVRVMVESDSKFPGAIYFGTPWTISTVAK